MAAIAKQGNIDAVGSLIAGAIFDLDCKLADHLPFLPGNVAGEDGSEPFGSVASVSQVRGGEVLKERPVGEGVESLARGRRAGVAKYPQAAAAELNEFGSCLPGIDLGLEPPAVQERSSFLDQLVLCDSRLYLVAGVQPPGEMAKGRFEKVSCTEFEVDPPPGIP